MEKKFKEKQWILVRKKNQDRAKWEAYIYMYEEKFDIFSLGGFKIRKDFNEIIPYEGNEHLLGTTDPYEPPYEPKVGDFVRIEGKGETIIGIYKGDWYNLYVSSEHLDGECGYNCAIYDIHPATEEEKQLLLGKMHEAGKDWDSEKMKVVDYEWKPKKGEKVLLIFYEESSFSFKYLERWYNPDMYKEHFKRGLVLKIGQTVKAQSLCDKLNEAIKNIK